MCLPKAPKMDPAIKAQQQRQKQLEQERMREEKERTLNERRRALRGTGVRSLISGSGSGFGSNTEG